MPERPLNQLSYEAADQGRWVLRDLIDIINGFMAQLLGASHLYRKVKPFCRAEFFFRLLYAIAKIR